jgi:hypothetical protein
LQCLTREFGSSALVSSPPTQSRSPPEPDPLDDPPPTAPRPDAEPPASGTPPGGPPTSGVPPTTDVRPSADASRDRERPSASDASTATDGSERKGRTGHRSEDPPGLREQIGSTRDSAKRLVDAHLELARAEFEDIGGAIKRAAILAGLALGALLVAGLLATVGTPLFLGELIFGSIGWGLLHGLLLLFAIAVAAGLAAIGTDGSRLGRSMLFAVVIGIVVGVVLALNLTNRAWSALGDAFVPLVATDSRPLVAALVALPIVGGVVVGLLSLIRALRETERGTSDRPSIGSRLSVGLPTAAYVGWLAGFAYAYTTGALLPDWQIFAAAAAGAILTEVAFAIIGAWRPGFGLLTGLTIGVLLGLALAFLTAIAFGRRVGAAIGVTTGLLALPGLLAADFVARGIDVESLKDRFVPQQTIAMTKETIEWVLERTPLTRK